MRFLLYLITTLLTGFIAGIFRSRVLVFLFLAEAVLLVLLFLQAVLTCISVSLRGMSPLWLFRKDEEGQGAFLLRSRLAFPVRRLILRGSLAYEHEDTPQAVKLSGGLAGRALPLQVALRCPLCGIRRLRVTALSCGDTLGLFSFRKRCRVTQTIAVLPPSEPRFSLDLSSVSTALAALENAPSASYMREHDEFRQIREYVPGDSLRTIDWHQSARSDSLMVREYDTLQEYYIDLEMTGAAPALPTAAGFSAFYELTAALARGIIAAGAICRIYWYDARSAQLVSFAMKSDREVDEMLPELYLSRLVDPADLPPDALKGFPKSRTVLELRLAPDLVLYSGTRKLFAFEADRVADEIAGRRLVL